MRSSVNTGVGAGGFRAGVRQTHKGSSSFATRAHPPFLSSLSPTTRAVMITAFAAAVLFVLYDIHRAYEAANGELRMAGHAMAHEVSRMDIGTATRTIDVLRARMVPDAEVTIERAGMAGPAPFPDLAHIIEAGALGSIAVRRSGLSVLSSVAVRGAGAFGTAFLVSIGTAAMGRRRTLAGHRTARPGDLEGLVDAIPSGVACWTANGRMLTCNESFRRTIGAAFSVVAGQSYHDTLDCLLEDGHTKTVSACERERVLELQRPDGQCLLIEERRFHDGFITLVSDVTEQKRADDLLDAIRQEQRQLARRYHEEKLRAEAANRSKTNFLAHLSHDIRTPLNHIIGFADLIRHETYGPLGDRRYIEYVGNIKESGEHLLTSFAAILELAELESGGRLPKMEPLCLDTLLERVSQRFRRPAQEAGLRLKLGEASGAELVGDVTCLERMLCNVIENAIYFTPAGGTISLIAHVGVDGVVIEVTDTGIGMSKERLAGLSQPFALGDASFSREGIGPGLGIPIARAIAELSGGRMAIDSSPALGTTVAFSLPLRCENEMHAADYAA